MTQAGRDLRNVSVSVPLLFDVTTILRFDTAIQINKEDLLDWFVGTPLAILVIVCCAVGLRMLVSRLITRVTKQAVDRSSGDRLIEARRATRTSEMSDLLMGHRRIQRAKAIASLLKSLATATIVVIAALLILAQFHIDIGPLLASASILGAAIAFGAQNLIKDYLSGISMILEDQYGVDDVVDLGPAVGTVENVTLRVTQLRDMSGVVWYVRNGEVLRVANRSKGWTMSSVTVAIAYNEDLDNVREIIEKVATDMDDDSKYDSMLLDKPVYAGIESVSGDAVFIKVSAKSAPEQQGAVSMIIRERLKVAFDRAGVKVPTLTTTAYPLAPGLPGAVPGTGAPGTPGSTQR